MYKAHAKTPVRAMQTAEAPMASRFHFFGVMLGWVISYRDLMAATGASQPPLGRIKG